MSKLLPQWQQAHVLETVFDQLSDALVLYDTRHSITGMNRAAERLFGVAADEMVGHNCREVFRCSECEPGCGLAEGLVAGRGRSAAHGHRPDERRPAPYDPRVPDQASSIARAGPGQQRAGPQTGASW